jgi:hypothetical protein
LEQQVLIPNGVIVDYSRTIYFCEGTGLYCRLTVVVDNQFYNSSGTVTGTGTAILQYQTSGSLQGTTRRRTKTMAATLSNILRTTTATQEQLSHVQSPPCALRESGGIVGSQR